ncbi:hypothetical protein CBM2585_A130110 [Cupriavidus taiwanensis]|nr:hypothetical protein CBM2585_A130110 [Cupriavidus taiwanensis]SOZ05369.1 hypothetical protein CBM2595_A80054 [Cupriavidus taiwanensis]
MVKAIASTAPTRIGSFVMYLS